MTQQPEPIFVTPLSRMEAKPAPTGALPFHVLHRSEPMPTGGKALFIVYGHMAQSPFYATQIEAGVKQDAQGETSPEARKGPYKPLLFYPTRPTQKPVEQPTGANMWLIRDNITYQI